MKETIYKRIFVIVLDSLGIGAMPDSEKFGDRDVDTFGHILDRMGTLEIPNLQKLGMLNLHTGGKMYGIENPIGKITRLKEASNGKDTMTGHWEMMGIYTEKPFKTFTEHGFPPELIAELEKRCGKKVIGNRSESGTKIIEELGEEEIETGAMIVYTSADSVFQIAAHEDVIPLEELYKMCETARAMLTGDNLVGRVIARPFIGGNGKYTRTENRRDFALQPVGETILDALCGKGMDVVGIGKIEDIFAHRGITTVDHTKNNHDGIESTLRFLKEGRGDFIFTNLVDFDMLYGHRNDVEGYAAALEYFDSRLPELLGAMKDGDFVIITADHGCDPCFPGTDHTREYIPILAFGKDIQPVSVGTRNSFADIGATVYRYLTDEKFGAGESFLNLIRK